MACDHYSDPEAVSAREELSEAVKKYSAAVSCEGPSHVVMGATVVWETTAFGEDGEPIYTMQHVVLDPGSLIHAAGLLTVARDRLSSYINTPNQGDRD